LYRFMRVTTVATCAGLALLMASPAFAHETRTVGDYEFVVGFADEPAYAGSKNGVGVAITDAKTGDPVVKGVELEVELGFGDETMTLPVEPEFLVGVFGEPGTYGAPFFPTRSGPYTFHFTGTVAGQDIDESFTSGPDTFGEAEDPGEVSFPARDPSTGELAERLDQEVPRLTAAVDDAESAADGAKTLTIVALIVGALGLIVGALALARGRATT
jgi:hypothetical protein